MKEATITLKLDKHLTVVKTGVTPIEALLLTAEHHRGAGENPVEVHKDTIEDIPETEVTVMEGTPPKEVKKKVSRTEDEEIARLRGKYHPNKIKALLTEVRNLPKDFDEAAKKGIDLVLPTSATFAESGKK